MSPGITVSPLTEKELDLIEDVLGPAKLFLFNKVWEERRAVFRHERSVRGTVKHCRELKKRELLYWENKHEETKKVLAHMDETLRELVLDFEGKVEPKFYARILELTDPYNKIGREDKEEEPLY